MSFGHLTHEECPVADLRGYKGCKCPGHWAGIVAMPTLHEGALWSTRGHSKKWLPQQKLLHGVSWYGSEERPAPQRRASGISEHICSLQEVASAAASWSNQVYSERPLAPSWRGMRQEAFKVARNRGGGGSTCWGVPWKCVSGHRHPQVCP